MQVHQDLKPENCMVHLATRTLKVLARCLAVAPGHSVHALHSLPHDCPGSMSSRFKGSWGNCLPWKCTSCLSGQRIRQCTPCEPGWLDSRVITLAAAQVIDFGLSHAADDAAAPCLGTPEYIAPETLVGAQAGDGDARPVPQAVDIWGAGIVLYMLVAGRYPFQVRGLCVEVC